MSGHHATHEGLQKHSVGDLYPLAIVGVGDLWRIDNLVTGMTAGYQFSNAPYVVPNPDPPRGMSRWCRTFERSSDAVRFAQLLHSNPEEDGTSWHPAT